MLAYSKNRISFFIICQLNPKTNPRLLFYLEQAEKLKEITKIMHCDQIRSCYKISLVKRTVIKLDRVTHYKLGYSTCCFLFPKPVIMYSFVQPTLKLGTKVDCLFTVFTMEIKRFSPVRDRCRPSLQHLGY